MDAVPRAVAGLGAGRAGGMPDFGGWWRCGGLAVPAGGGRAGAGCAPGGGSEGGECLAGEVAAADGGEEVVHAGDQVPFGGGFGFAAHGELAEAEVVLDVAVGGL